MILQKLKLQYGKKLKHQKNPDSEKSLLAKDVLVARGFILNPI